VSRREIVTWGAALALVGALGVGAAVASAASTHSTPTVTTTTGAPGSNHRTVDEQQAASDVSEAADATAAPTPSAPTSASPEPDGGRRVRRSSERRQPERGSGRPGRGSGRPGREPGRPGREPGRPGREPGRPGRGSARHRSRHDHDHHHVERPGGPRRRGRPRRARRARRRLTKADRRRGQRCLGIAPSAGPDLRSRSPRPPWPLSDPLPAGCARERHRASNRARRFVGDDRRRRDARSRSTHAFAIRD